MMHSGQRGNAIPFFIITHPLCNGGRGNQMTYNTPFSLSVCTVVHNGKEGGGVNNNGRGNQMTLRHALSATNLHSGALW